MKIDKVFFNFWKDCLANVILNDAGLQEDLNLDTPDNPDYNSSKGLNYLAVAKVGILTFADYIHDIYIADGGWREQTWNWIFDPGYTLVDLVNDIFSVAANAVSIIKAGVTSVMNAVKAGMEFIGNIALEATTSVYVFVLQLLIQVIAEIIQTLNQPLLTVMKTSKGMTINNVPIEVVREGLDILFSFDKITFNIGNPFNGSKFEFETLGLSHNIAFGLDIGFLTMSTATMIASTLGQKGVVQGIKAATVSIMSVLFLGVIGYVLNPQNTDRSEFLEEFLEFTGFTGFSSLFLSSSLTRNANLKTGQLPKGSGVDSYRLGANVLLGLSIVVELISLYNDFAQVRSGSDPAITAVGAVINLVTLVGGFISPLLTPTNVDDRDMASFFHVVAITNLTFFVVFNLVKIAIGL